MGCPTLPHLDENERPIFLGVWKKSAGKENCENYYPFGLTFNSSQRENVLANQDKFQGQEHQDELDLGWDSLKWRNHMPELGRFFNVDPLAEKYAYNSPYAFSENKVTGHVELEGLESAKAALDQALANVRAAFEQILGTPLTNPKAEEKPTEEEEKDEKKKSKGVGITVTGDGGPNEEDLPDGDPEGKQYSTQKSFWDAIFGSMTKSKPVKNGSGDTFKNAKTAADDAKDAEENARPASSDTLVAQPSYTNGGNWANESFVIGDDTTLLIIYSPQPDGKNADSVYSRKSNAKEFEQIRNGNWHQGPRPSRPPR